MTNHAIENDSVRLKYGRDHFGLPQAHNFTDAAAHPSFNHNLKSSAFRRSSATLPATSEKFRTRHRTLLPGLFLEEQLGPHQVDISPALDDHFPSIVCFIRKGNVARLLGNGKPVLNAAVPTC